MKVNACSVCWGSGVTMDGKPCPCGCMPINMTRQGEEITTLRQRVAELEKQNNDLWESFNLPRNDDILAIEKLTAERAALKQQRDDLLKAISIAEPVMDAHAGPSRLADFRAAIASVKEKQDASD